MNMNTNVSQSGPTMKVLFWYFVLASMHSLWLCLLVCRESGAFVGPGTLPVRSLYRMPTSTSSFTAVLRMCPRYNSKKLFKLLSNPLFAVTPTRQTAWTSPSATSNTSKSAINSTFKTPPPHSASSALPIDAGTNSKGRLNQSNDAMTKGRYRPTQPVLNKKAPNKVGGKNFTKTIEINNKITEVFAVSPYGSLNAADLERLRLYIADRRQHLNAVNIATLLHRCAKRNADVLQVLDMSTITQGLRQSRMNAQCISNALYGLQSMSDNSLGVSSLLQVLSDQLTGLQPNKDDVFTAQAIATALYGLKGFTTSTKEVRSLLRSLSRIIQQLDPLPLMNAQGISSAFFGMQGMSSRCPEANELLHQLARMLAEVRQPLDPQAVANILWGLRNCDSDSQHVCTVLDSLSDHLEVQMSKTTMSNCDSGDFENVIGRMTTKELSMAIHGMNGMSSAHPSTRRLLSAFNNALKIAPNNSSVDTAVIRRQQSFSRGDELGPMLKGFEGLSNTHVEVREFLKHVNSMINITSNTNLTEAQLRSCFCSLNSMSSFGGGTAEVMELIKTLTKLVYQSSTENTSLSDREVASILYSLKGIGCRHDAVRGLLRAVCRKFNRKQLAPTSTSASAQPNTANVSPFAGQHIAMMCYGLQSMSITSENPESNGGSNTNTELVTVLHMIADHVHSTEGFILTPSQLSSAIYGFKSMRSNHPAPLKLLSALTRKIDTAGVDTLSEPMITGREMAMVMMGLRGMSSVEPSIQQLLQRLTTLFARSNATLDNNQLTTLVNSMQSFGGGIVSRSNHSTDRDSTLQPKSDMLKPEDESINERTDASDTSDVSEASDASEGRLKTGTSSLGFGIMTPTRARSYRLPRAVTGLIDVVFAKVEGRSQPLSGPNVATALFGLQGMTPDAPSVRRLLTVLTDDLDSSNNDIDVQVQRLNSQNIGNALFALQNMTCRCKEVRRLLGSLAVAIDLSSHDLTAQAVGNAFYGLQYMSSETLEVRAVLRALTHKVWQMPNITASNEIAFMKAAHQNYTMTGQNIGNAFWGLRNMTSDHPEVREAVAALACKTKQSTAIMNGQNIGNALYSLHAMDDNYDEVKDALVALAHKIVVTTQPLSGLDVAMALYGLKNKDSNSPEIRVILGCLIHKIKNSDIEFPLRELSMAIIGILKTSEWIRDDFLRVLAAKTPGMVLQEVDNLGLQL